MIKKSVLRLDQWNQKLDPNEFRRHFSRIKTKF